MLYHFSDQPDIARFEPRAIDGSTEPVVWAIDASRQCNYLLPRDCPRVTYYAGANAASNDIEHIIGPNRHQSVVAIQQAWLARVRSAKIFRYALPPETFACIDAPAGYFVSRCAVVPLSIDVIADLPAANVATGAVFRVLPSLWPIHDAVIASTLQYSMIRMRNAQVR